MGKGKVKIRSGYKGYLKGAKVHPIRLGKGKWPGKIEKR
jgi:hypothetical protein